MELESRPKKIVHQILVRNNSVDPSEPDAGAQAIEFHPQVVKGACRTTSDPSAWIAIVKPDGWQIQEAFAD
jgi:hypothetical protein